MSFKEQEIKTALFELSVDGFPSFFLQKNWSLVKTDIIALFTDLFNGTLEFGRLNHALAVLIAKCDGADNVRDYRPISLLNCIFKTITKVLANKLRGLMDSLVLNSQSAFIKDGSIFEKCSCGS